MLYVSLVSAASFSEIVSILGVLAPVHMYREMRQKTWSNVPAAIALIVCNQEDLALVVTMLTEFVCF